MKPPAERIVRPYCLRCYQALEARDGPSHACERCGFVNLKLDQKLYWTREPALCDLEGWAKTITVYVLIGLGLLLGIGFGSKASFGTGQGWAVGFPILVGVLLWETASKITGRKPYFRATIVWRILLAIPVVPMLLLVHDLRAKPVIAAVLLVLSAGSILGVVFLGRIGRSLERWRDHRVLKGQRSGRQAGRPASRTTARS